MIWIFINIFGFQFKIQKVFSSLVRIRLFQKRIVSIKWLIWSIDCFLSWWMIYIQFWLKKLIKGHFWMLIINNKFFPLFIWHFGTMSRIDLRSIRFLLVRIYIHFCNVKRLCHYYIILNTLFPMSTLSGFAPFWLSSLKYFPLFLVILSSIDKLTRLAFVLVNKKLLVSILSQRWMLINFPWFTNFLKIVNQFFFISKSLSFLVYYWFY